MNPIVLKSMLTYLLAFTLVTMAGAFVANLTGLILFPYLAEKYTIGIFLVLIGGGLSYLAQMCYLIFGDSIAKGEDNNAVGFAGILLHVFAVLSVVGSMVMFLVTV